MGQTTEDFAHAGTHTFLKAPSLPAASIGDAAVDASRPLGVTKMRHRFRPTYAQPNTAATTVTIPLFRCYGATATVIEIACGSIAVAVGAATVTIDVKKNGTSILTGGTPVTLDNTNSVYAGRLASIVTSSMVAGDVLTLVITATAGGGTLPTGLYVAGTIDEDPT